jgi:hypothetical protein
MLTSKRTLLVVLAIVLTCLTVASAYAPPAAACYPAGVYRYYSNQYYTNQVGQMTVTCACKITVTGTKTGYVRFTAYTCGIEN